MVIIVITVVVKVNILLDYVDHKKWKYKNINITNLKRGVGIDHCNKK